MKKKQNRRSVKIRPGLSKAYNLRIRWDELDQDYAHTLSEENKDYLNAFNEEFVNANFNHKGPILHNTDELKKSCYDRNNRRNRDVYGLAKAKKGLEFNVDYKKPETSNGVVFTERMVKDLEKKPGELSRALKIRKDSKLFKK